MSEARRLVALAVLWLLAWGAVLGGVGVASLARLATYTTMNVELPLMTELLIQSADLVAQGPGVLAIAAGLAFGAAPLWLVPPGPALRRWFVVGLAQSVAFALFSWSVLELPIAAARRCLCDEPHPGQEGPFMARLIVVTLPLVLGLAIAQGHAWWSFAREARALAAGPLSLEAARALVISALPALGLGSLAFFMVLGGLPVPSTLLVPAPLAAGGTVALGCYVLALWRRLLVPQS